MSLALLKKSLDWCQSCKRVSLRDSETYSISHRTLETLKLLTLQSDYAIQRRSVWVSWARSNWIVVFDEGFQASKDFMKWKNRKVDQITQSSMLVNKKRKVFDIAQTAPASTDTTSTTSHQEEEQMLQQPWKRTYSKD